MKNIVKSIEFKNIHIKHLIALMNVKLSGRKSRLRNKFLNIVNIKGAEIEKERIKIMEEMADKDENGKAIIDKATNNYKISEGVVKKANDLFTDLMNEKVIFDILPSNEDIFDQARDIILNSKLELDSSAGEMYDEICEIFEKVKFETKK
jgi:hypothetical protein